MMAASQINFNDYSKRCVNAGAKMVLATVVDVRGSAYRRPGAHMLMADDGTKCGTISAGCLEADLEARLRLPAMPMRPELIEYNSGPEDMFELNLGCQGAITLLVEPFDPNGINPVWASETASGSGKFSVLATIIQTDRADLLGARLFLDGKEAKGLGDDEDKLLRDTLIDVCSECLHRKESLVREVEIGSASCKVFIDIIKPAIQLYIFGTGDDVLPVVELAAALNMVPHVVGWRARPKTLPAQVHYIQWQQPFAVDIGYETSAFVIMSHNYEKDRQFLAEISKFPVRYIGVMGPKRRTERMLVEIAESTGEAVVDKNGLHFPIGLDLGADTPVQIALSIVAEIQSVFSGTTGGFLAQKTGPIHGQSPLLSCGASRPQTELLLVILAAGLGSRLGLTKPLVKWKQTTLLQNMIDVCAASESGDIAVVTGYRHSEVREAVPEGVRILHNEEYAEGIASSIRMAAKFAHQGGYKYLMLLCCDQPFIEADDLTRMIAARRTDRPITAAEYADTFGIPAIFGAEVFDDLLALQGDKGAKRLIAVNKHRTTTVPLENAAFDLDTPEQLAGLLAGSK